MMVFLDINIFIIIQDDTDVNHAISQGSLLKITIFDKVNT